MSIQLVQKRIPAPVLPAALMLLTLTVTAARAVPAGTSSPEPNPSPESSPAVPAASSSGFLSLPTFMLVASFAVIALALFFAMRYHKALLEFMATALAGGTVYGGKSEKAYVAQRGIDAPRSDKAPDAHIIGNATAAPGQELLFILSAPLFDEQEPRQLVNVQWSVDGASVDGNTTYFLKHAFKKSGPHVVEATAGDHAIAPFPVVISGGKAGSGPSLPFAIQNWGRMVVLLFGLGVVGALMASTVLSSEAGAGLLGALLGIGAATASSGDGTKGDGSNGTGDAKANDEKP